MKSLFKKLLEKKMIQIGLSILSFKEPINTIRSGSYRYKWVRISNRPNGFYDLIGYDPSFESSLSMGADRRGFNIEGIDENELKKLRKIGKVKRFQINNTTSIYVAIISLVFSAIFAFCSLILTAIINYEKLDNFYRAYFIKHTIKQEKIVNH